MLGGRLRRQGDKMKLIRKIISGWFLLSGICALFALLDKETLTSGSFIGIIILSVFMYFLSYLIYPFKIHYPLKNLFKNNTEVKEEPYTKNRPIITAQDKIVLPKKDTSESTFTSDNNGAIPLNQIVLIHYTDANGNFSKRRITIKKLIPYGDDIALLSYCHEREANRTFLLSRIEKMIDIETNHKIENPVDYLMNRFNDSEIGHFSNFMETHEDKILILVFISRTDGRMSAKERSIIADYMLKLSPEIGNKEFIEKEVKNLFCELNTFRDAVKKVSILPMEEKAELMEYAKQIVYSKKEIDPIEKGALEKLQKKFDLTTAST